MFDAYEWYEITYGTNTGYVPKPCIALEGSTDPIPDPGDSGGTGGDSTTPTIPGGSSSGQGVQMTVNINGKNTEVVLSLANFTYDYDQPETVTMIAGFNLRKGPNAAFGTYRNVRKGTQLTIIGRDREWLKVDMGNGKIAYVLEDMTTK